MTSARTALGVDVGGTGIKGAVVDLDTGRLITERHRIPTPSPATPAAVGATIAEIAQSFAFSGPVGVDFPGVVLDGVVQTAANVDKSWIGTSLPDVVGHLLPGPSVYLNDADAAGLGEAVYGAGHGEQGTVIMVTFGTGIGTAIIHNGVLVPNSELGHIEIDGEDAEHRASALAREREDLSWEEWAGRASRYLQTLEALLWPRLFILGGGISKKPHKWVPHLHTRTPIVVAELLNNAGIVGAAHAAWEAAQRA
jgi:polyphosphate glucokinase